MKDILERLRGCTSFSDDNVIDTVLCAAEMAIETLEAKVKLMEGVLHDYSKLPDGYPIMAVRSKAQGLLKKYKEQ